MAQLPSVSIEQAKKIELILKYKFNDAISQIRVHSWLNNFKKAEWDLAITVFEHIEYYTLDKLCDLLNSEICEITKTNNSLIFIPIGSQAKSGDVMLYLIQKMKQSWGKAINYRFCRLCDEDENSIQDDDVIILVDDFVGTGKTVESFVESNIGIIDAILARKIQIILLCCFMMDFTLNRLRRRFPDITFMPCEIKYRAFDNEKSLFGSHSKMVEVRKFCYKYGQKIIGKRRRDDMKPLGFGNCQSLVVMEQSTPNDTLPLIWGSTAKGEPLFPRFYDKKVMLSRIQRSENVWWMAKMAHSFKQTDNDINWKEYFSNTNYVSLLILKILISDRIKSEYRILNTLGLSKTEFQQLKQYGLNKGMWDQNLVVPDNIRKMYFEILYKLRHRKQEEMDTNICNKKIYVPETFKGLS